MKRYVVGLCASLFLLAGCVVASPDVDTYKDAAASTLGTAVSEVATVQTMLDLLERGRIGRPAIVTQMRYSEDALSRAAQGFRSLNPPINTDRLADRAGELLDEAANALETTRLAIHRGLSGDYPALILKLDQLADSLQALESSLS